MPIGPVEYIVIAFPGNKFNGQIVPALKELVDNGTIHLIDLLFIKKDADGNVLVVELEQSDEEGAGFADVDGEYGDLLTMEDIELAAAELPANCSAALLVWENTWAARFADAVRAANGQVIANERIPHALVEAAIAAALAEG